MPKSRSEFFDYNGKRSFRIKKAHVRLRNQGLNKREIQEVAGMLRGLACAINGFKAVSGLPNKNFLKNDKVVFKFATVEDAKRFVKKSRKYFDNNVIPAKAMKNVQSKKGKKS